MQMDPLAALQAEIKKRKSDQAASKQPSRRWRSQAEIEREREQQYYKRQKEADEHRQHTKRRRFHDALTASTTVTTTTNNNVTEVSAETSDEKTYNKADATNSQCQKQVSCTVPTEKNDNNIPNNDSKNGGDDDDNKKNNTVEEIPPLSKDDVIRKLRALKQPATLFGETDWTRFQRLRELQLSKDDHSDGQDNVYQKKMREVRAKDAAEDAVHFNSHDTKPADEHDHGTGNGGSTKPNSAGDGVVSASSSDVMIKGNANNIKKRDDDDDDVNDATKCKEDFVHGFIRKYMRLWHGELDAMSKDERRSNKGRSQLATYEQTKDWLKPLEKLLRKRKLSKTILDALKDIFHAAAQREYMAAMRLYLERLAIGNAPWPMGATQVGIHSRAAREKIGEDKIAHVMNDEQTRKYIQAVKRLLTVAQRHFPTDASKSAST